MSEKIRVVHYLNQFFAQFGGEEKADIGPGFKEGPIGPGRALEQALGQQGEVVATCFCGDNYFAEYLEEATAELLRQIEVQALRKVRERTRSIYPRAIRTFNTRVNAASTNH